MTDEQEKDPLDTSLVDKMVSGLGESLARREVLNNIASIGVTPEFIAKQLKSILDAPDVRVRVQGLAFLKDVVGLTNKENTDEPLALAIGRATDSELRDMLVIGLGELNDDLKDDLLERIGFGRFSPDESEEEETAQPETDGGSEEETPG